VTAKSVIYGFNDAAVAVIGYVAQLPKSRLVGGLHCVEGTEKLVALDQRELSLMMLE
jgi:hypothetical protein